MEPFLLLVVKEENDRIAVLSFWLKTWVYSYGVQGGEETVTFQKDFPQIACLH